MTTKEQIRELLSFEEFYRGELQNLKPTADDNYQALCPFHEDKNPSLSVNFKTGLYKCFGCGVSGDEISFYMRLHGVDFKEALAALGRRVGVEAASVPSGYMNLPRKEFALAKRLPEDFLEQHGVMQYRFPDGTLCTDFHYKNQKSKPSAIRHRFANQGDKKFRWRKGDRVGLYGLWRLAEVEEAGWFLLVEGETDALTCWFHGLPALGLPGKKTWRRCKTALGKAGLESLKDFQVYLWQEPDAKELPGEVAMDLPDLLVIPAPPEFKDLSEAHCQGRDIPALVEQLKARAKPPAPPLTPPVVESSQNLSDLGNARRLVAQHGQDLRYLPTPKIWRFYTGTHWAHDIGGTQAMRLAKKTVGAIYGEAASADEDQRKNFAAFGLKSENAARLQAMITLAQSEPGITIDVSKFDADHYLLNVANGTIDLRTGELRPHDRRDLLTRMVGVNYDPGAVSDLWERFLYEIMDVNRQPRSADNLVEFLRRALGYSLTGSTKEECLFILWGGGQNGKSTLINVVSEIMGEYSRNTPIETLLMKNSSTIPVDLARLDGPRLVTAAEVDRGRRLAESLVKTMTGRDTISARFFYAEFFDFRPQFKLWLSTNHKPVIKGTDDAIWRRIMFVKFPVQIPMEKRDLDLGKKLLAESPGVLRWLVQGCLAWQREGLSPPPEVMESTAAYRAEMDVLADFLAECCIVAPGATATAAALYSAYTAWADEAGLKDREKMKQRTFGMCLSDRGFERDRGTGNKGIWKGLELK